MVGIQFYLTAFDFTLYGMYLHLFDVPEYLSNSLPYSFESIVGHHLNEKGSQK